MTKTEAIIRLDASDGEAVAKYLFGYLNARPCCDNEQFCRVLETFPHQGYNFLILSLLWFEELRRVKKPAYNFEASVELAKAVCKMASSELEGDLMGLMLPTTEDTHSHCLKVVDGANEIDAVRAVVCFLSRKEHKAVHYNDFLETMGSDHGTLQQSLTRLIMTWCWWVHKAYPIDSKDNMAVLARMICSCDRALPYI